MGITRRALSLFRGARLFLIIDVHIVEVGLNVPRKEGQSGCCSA